MLKHPEPGELTSHDHSWPTMAIPPPRDEAGVVYHGADMGVESSLTIEWWAISKVKPFKDNPRTITEAAVSKVAQSLTEFGWRQPLVVDRKGVIIVGHVRWRAAKKLKQETVPVHVAEISEAQARAYRLADNRTGEESHWDWSLLKVNLEDLAKELDQDLGITGFDNDELDRWLKPVAQAVVQQVGEAKDFEPSQPSATTFKPVTREEVEQTETKLASHQAEIVAGRDENKITVTCPFCAKDFAFSGS